MSSATDTEEDQVMPESLEQAAALRSAANRELARDLIAFVGTVAAVIFFDWKAKDVIWGLWICSLTFGYTTIVVTIFAPALRAGGGAGAAMAAGGLFLLAFFTVHFGMFHFVHGQFLNQFFPLGGTSGAFLNPYTLITWPLSLYWPMVLATFVSRFSDLPFEGGSVIGKGNATGGAAFMKPYANVIRMHLLIFVFAGLHAANMADLAIYPVLLFYFFPWSAFFGKRGAAN